MHLNDGDLVFKLLSLPPEAREELLSMVGDPDMQPVTAVHEALQNRFPARRAPADPGADKP